MSIKDQLKNITKSDYPRFTLNGIEAHAKVVYIYDGDTCDVVFYHKKMKDFVRFKCRLLGFDAPELDEPYGELVRNYLAQLCMGKTTEELAKYAEGELAEYTKEQLQEELDQNTKTVYAMFGKEEKYGRALVTLKTSPEGECINDVVRMFVDWLENPAESNSEASTSSDMD
jgi:endonuclease YncB( thermonuclease family)